ncbi:hypothetical protein EIN_405030 [Entamoeba invadens IP1]|uniref:Uncharacterized protein n=1 Tax=Entamoeba invadens IP1 TaxID=370355 RepID=A0A0A1UCR9_ENTIV|nr:hypothetical protein EIN_405030 [Entamoeba invadens IP1]ELP90089.1 hypothetical protein EIN_405030 [Entamoeba invadens IP1]|eukprot:XP_004256860.1 hypothetical protein EIN_405030 [Entamoeba invadens IP1]
MSEDNDSSVLIHEEENKEQEFDDYENTIDTIVGTKVTTTTFTLLSLFVFLTAAVILVLFDPNRVLCSVICLIFVVMLPIISVRIDGILQGNVVYYFIPIFVMEILNSSLRVSDYYKAIPTYVIRKESFGHDFSFGCMLASDIFRMLFEVFLCLTIRTVSIFGNNYLYCGSFLILSLIFYFISFLFFRETTARTGLVFISLRGLFVLFSIAQILMICFNVGQFKHYSKFVASIPVLIYLVIIHVLFIASPVLYFSLFKKINSLNVPQFKESFLHQN